MDRASRPMKEYRFTLTVQAPEDDNMTAPMVEAAIIDALQNTLDLTQDSPWYVEIKEEQR